MLIIFFFFFKRTAAYVLRISNWSSDLCSSDRPGAFGELQRLAARIDYSGEEPNYTFALATLASRLARRSMIVLLTEFTDATSAEFLVQSPARLMRTHLLLVVVMRDDDPDARAERVPVDIDDATPALTAPALRREHLRALTRLRHLGSPLLERENAHAHK